MTHHRESKNSLNFENQVFLFKIQFGIQIFLVARRATHSARDNSMPAPMRLTNGLHSNAERFDESLSSEDYIHKLNV